MEGAVERVRPKMMTVTATMVGGMISSTLLTLIVIPAIYAWVKGRGLQ
jgi:Cu(I)/Ag(I) efflux system membrane protein CusA/SilA